MFSNCTKQKREKQRRNIMNLWIIINNPILFFITVQINEKEKKEKN